MGLAHELARGLEELDAQGLRRSLDTAPQDGADFCSNDYLGFTRHPEIVAAARAALEEHGAGSGAARLLGGSGPAQEMAELAATDWLGAEASLLFPSGYQANLGVIGALAGRGDVVVSDARNHASLIDAARLSHARVEIFRHLDLEEAERKLERARGARRRLLVTESVFSMDGDLAPLSELHELCARHDAWLVIDEAHAAGLLGPLGAGAWPALDHPGPRLAARVVTGGKALGVGGAFVAGSSAVVSTLLQRARSFLFTTAPPPALAGALARSIELCSAADNERTQALEHAATLAQGLGLAGPAGAIVPFRLGDPARSVETAAHLSARGLRVRAVRPPTVADGESGLRLVTHATNTSAELDDLLRGLQDVGPPDLPAEIAPAAPALFVTGTDTGVGKTVVSALLVRAAKRAGAVRYWKAVQTGDESDTDAVTDLAGLDSIERLPPAWSLALPASPHEAAADEGVVIDPARVVGALASLRRLVPEAVHIVELAGGLLVPYTHGADAYTQADLLEQVRAPLVLVARSGLGTLNHTLLSFEALRARHLEPRALFLVGEPHDSNRETLRAMTGVPLVFEVPLFDPLETAALDAFLDAHPLGEVLP